MSESEIKRIAELLIKYSREELTLAEEKQLQEWKEANPGSFEKLFSDQVFLELGEEDDSRKRIAATIRERIAQSSQEDTIKSSSRRRILIARTWWVAALVLIIGSVIGVVSIVGHKVNSGSAINSHGKSQNDIFPGKNKAILTLAGGSIIVLDSVQNGTLVKEAGISIEKRSDGKLAYSSSHEKPLAIQFNTLTIPRGGQYFLELSDGSKIWLNAASSLRYPVSFIGNERKVQLTGEAFFEIAKATDRQGTLPFIVDVLTSTDGKSAAKITVLGTHFNVNAYDDETAIRTTLLEGRVKISMQRIAGGNSSEQGESVTLSPGQQALVRETNPASNVAQGIKVINDADTGEVVSWKNGVTSFVNEDIKSIMRKISRWYDVDVVYEGNIPERSFMGGIPRNSNLSEVLKVLELSNIHFTVEGRRITVKP
ncbi:MAG: hypothetical protein BGO55_23595 [Sphingobacteriales bacterium 50-39]|nr:DUF4974 domain-containing protein [Sphingobacteriales bacterium]OJW58286.1 MAG: hypothetical protein BGO55_23595 [Sphingobacteriales bacterium 50-39]